MKNRILYSILSVFFVFSLTGSAVAADFIKLKKTDKCPVCGMFVKKYKRWVAQVIFKDGSYRVFDGSKDMFKYLFKMKKYEKKLRREDVTDIYVTEYYTTKVMKAEEVFFVVGSDVLGPMGHELVPVKGETETKIFMLDHGGKKMYRFNEITPDNIPR